MLRNTTTDQILLNALNAAADVAEARYGSQMADSYRRFADNNYRAMCSACRGKGEYPGLDIVCRTCNGSGLEPVKDAEGK